MADQNKAYKEALKNIENMIKKQEALNKSTKNLADSWNTVTSEIFKMDGANFFKNVEKSPEQLAKMGKEVENLTKQYESLGGEFSTILSNGEKFKEVQGNLVGLGKQYSNISKTISDNAKMSLDLQNSLSDDLRIKLKMQGDIEKILEEESRLSEKERKFSDEDIKKLKKLKDFQDTEKTFNKEKLKFQEEMDAHLQELIRGNSQIALLSKEVQGNVMSQLSAGKDVNEILKTATEEERKFLALLGDDTEELKRISKGMAAAANGVDDIKKKAGEMNKVFSLSKGLFEGMSSIVRKELVGSMLKFDEVVNTVQRNTGINMDDNSAAFARLQTNVAQFGMSVEQAGKMMADMSEELNTTNFSVLSKAAEDFAAIAGATGAADEDITSLAGNLMRMGESSEQVKDFMQGADQDARKFGVSSKRVLAGISKNMVKMRTMGFVGGEESLKKMTIQAERLHMSIDSVFNMAEKARNIEGAMDMAAELQLAGGSFSNINPMDLLAAARKGPAELQKILTGMGKDIGKFNEKGEYEFDPIDADRLKIAADAAGVTVDEFQKMISQNAIDEAKLNPFQGTLDGLGDADKELAKSGLTQMLKRSANGEITFDVDSDMAKKMGVNSMEELQAMSGQDLAKKMNADKKTLEDENKRNQSLKQSFDNFINAFMSIFSVFEPVLRWLTAGIQWLSGIFTEFMDFLGPWAGLVKGIVGTLILFGIMFGSSVGKFIIQGVGNFVKALINPKKALMGAFGGAKESPVGDKGPKPGVGQGFSSLAKGLKSMGASGVMKGIANVALAGPALLLFVPALPGLLVMSLIGTMDKTVVSGFKAVASGISAFGEKKGVLKGIAMIALSAIPLLLFTLALPGLLLMAGVGALSVFIVAGFEAISMGLGILGKNMTNILKGSLALAVVSLALGAFAFVATMMAGLDWMSVLAGIGIMALAVIALIVLGALMAGPQLLFLLIGAGVLILVGAALLIASVGLLAAAAAFTQLSTIDWGGFSKMGDALLSVVPGLFAFSLAAMMFMNPLTLLGIMFMVFALGGLVSVMAPLAQSLTVGADSLDRFADGLSKLSEAADKLSLEKLEKLKELSDSMSSMSSGSSAMAAMAAMANGTGGGDGKGGDGEVRKIEVNVKMNGRDMQNFIVRDNSILK